MDSNIISKFDKKEWVRWGFRLFLGREPERESDLNKPFTDIFDLQDKFLKSQEYAIIKKRARRATAAVEPAPGLEIKLIRNFKELDHFIALYDAGSVNLDRRQFLASHQLSFEDFTLLFGSHPPDADPFSPEYANWEMAFFEFLSGRSYDYQNEGLKSEEGPKEDIHPLSGLPLEAHIQRYSFFASLLAAVKPRPGDRVLEMGCGRGTLAELFETCGCDYHGVDASSFHVETARKRLFSSKARAQTQTGSFYDIESEIEPFDLIIFEASFHHCGDPLRMLRILHCKTKPSGRIILIHEPIRANFDRPWGLVRYDGESVMQIRKRGWMELGFRTDFFAELLKRTGWSLKPSVALADNSVLLEVVKH